jgi:hypothetical protein
MPSLASTTVTIYFGVGAVGNAFWTLEDPVRGALNGSYGLAGDIGSDVSVDVLAVDIRRGRGSPLDEFNAGTCTIVLDNSERTYDPVNTVSPYYGNVRPGKRVVVQTEGVTIFDGFVEDWDLDFDRGPGGGGSTATVVCVDALASLAAMEFDEWTATAGQTAGPRLTAVLNRSEVAWGWNRDIDTGVSTLQGGLVTWGSNVLNYMQLVTRSDLGRLFAARGGVLTFRDRHATLTASAAVLFSDGTHLFADLLTEAGDTLITEAGDTLQTDDTGAAGDETWVTFDDIEVVHGNELMFNRVSVDREGGIAQTVNDTASQSTPPDGVGVRTLRRSGLLLDSDTQSLDMARFLLQSYKAPTERVAAVTVDVHNTPDGLKGALLTLDIAELVDVVWAPHDTAPAYDRTCIVEGTEHTIRPFSHVMRIPLSNVEQATPWVLEDPVLGALDSVARLSF